MSDASIIDARLAAVQKKIRAANNAMYKNSSAFSAALNNLVALKTEEEALLIVKKAVIEAYSRVVLRTPVKTGRARASWQFDIWREPSGVVPEGEYGSDVMQKAVNKAVVAILNAPAAVWYIANHLDYIERLESGYSQQAPRGMVALTLAELTNHFRGVSV